MIVDIHNINSLQDTDIQGLTINNYFFSEFHRLHYRKLIDTQNTNIIRVYDKQQLKGYMFFVPKKKVFLKYHLQMPFVLYNNPVFLGKYKNTYEFYSELRKVLLKISEIIKKFNIFTFQCVPEFTYLLPFQWNGFKTTHRTTFIINNKDFDKNYSSVLKRKIKKAKNRLNIIPKKSSEVFFYLYNNSGKNFLSQYQKDILKRIIDNYENISMLVANDKNNEPIASAVFLNGEKENYYLIGTQHKNFLNYNALALILHFYIEKTISQNKVFNFEGSSMEPIERFFRSFGAKPITYPYIYKSIKLWQTV